MTTSTIASEVAAFVTFQNTNRGQGGVAVDYNALTGTVPTGDNTVTGVAGISSSGTLALGSGYNAVIFDGTNSVQAAATGSPDNYAVSVGTNGTETIVDENTGNTLAITGDAYLVFNGGAQNSDGSYQSLKIVGSGNFANIALMYDAAFERQPDLPGLEFYAQPAAAGTLSLHQAAVYFLNSPEFVKDYPALSAAPDNGGPNDQAFINELYGNILRRTPTASEVNFYVEALQGTLSGETAPADRALLLTYFAVSSENQKNSTWLINTDNGAYADAGYGVPGSVAASTELNVSAGGTVNASLIDVSTINGYIAVNGGSANGGLTANPGLHVIVSGESNITIYLSSVFTNVSLGAQGDTIYTPQSGGSNIAYGVIGSTGIGSTVYLSGTSNVLENPDPNGYGIPGTPAHAVPSPVIVYGMNSTDVLSFDRQSGGTGGPTSVEILPTPAAGTLYQGSSFANPAFGTSNTAPTGHYFNNTTLAINVGTVADNTAATMAKAAAAVYQPTTNLTGLNSNGYEFVLFFGQGPNNDTVIYKWFADSTHSVTAATMVGGLDLIGVAPSQLGTYLQAF